MRSVDAPDAWYLRGGPGAAELDDLVSGRRVDAVRRTGKLLLIDLDGSVSLGLRFGMTGRLSVDGIAAIERLEYSTARADPAWERFRLCFEPSGELVMIDPRRLGRVSVDPDETALGPDAAGIGPAALRAALAGSTTSLKARLMDQRRLAGLGNLLTDEILWRARLSPARPAGGLSPRETTRLHRVMRTTLGQLDARGGSHTGDLFIARVRGGLCPRCGAALTRSSLGGRTTFWCAVEQR